VALSGSAARRYAEAVVDLAGDPAAVAGYGASLERLARATGPETIARLRDPRVSLAHRRDALVAAAKDEPPVIRHLLVLLLERQRIALLPDIARAYAELVDRRAGIEKAKVTTPIELTSADRESLVRRLESASGRKIKATFAVDPSLLGGAKVQIGDHVIDASLAAQLEDLARELAG
jgi:F-type H+-transporting ATPase subunit delta